MSVSRIGVRWLAAGLVALGTLAGFTMTAGAAPAGVAAAVPRDGKFTGRTSQGLPVSLTVAGGTIRRLAYEFKVGGCGQKATTTGKIRVSGGRFRSSSSQFDPVTLRSHRTVIEGRFVTPTKVKGTIAASTACGDKKISFTARRG